MEILSSYKISISADIRFPIAPYFGLLWFDKETSVGIPIDYPIGGKWGEVLSPNETIEENTRVPKYISGCWLSLREERFYFYETEIDANSLRKAISDLVDTGDSLTFVIGFGAMGQCALWLSSAKKSCIIQYGDGETTYLSMRQFLPVRPDLGKHEFCELMIGDMDCNFSNEDYKAVAYRMKQYLYKYSVEFKQWGEGKWLDIGADESPEFEWLEDFSSDGTYDKLHDDRLMKYHRAGHPDRISLRFHKYKKSYMAYMFFNLSEMSRLFNRFYGVHPETKTDFIIRIDAENKKYELALYRQGLKEPVVIPESAYQLIVFKNKFEDYRSENYNQPRGAWIW